MEQQAARGLAAGQALSVLGNEVPTEGPDSCGTL
jgi:hypothetical protein